MYAIEDIKLEARDEDDNTAVYTVFQDGEQIHRFHITGQGDPVHVIVTYTDINKDEYFDMVVQGAAPSGTPTSAAWLYAYDVKNDREIPVLEDHTDLTEEQGAQLEELPDKKFFRLFPGYNGPDCTSGGQYVDEQGQIYYQLYVWENFNYNRSTGEMRLLLDYNKQTGMFDVADLLYCPDYVKP